MSNQGWIKIYRKIQDCWVWQLDKDNKFDRRSAWVDLLLLANHRDKKISIDGNPVIISRGQFHTSIYKLADRWGWDKRTVSRFLNRLENDEMLTQVRSSKGTTISIVNYGIYQSDSTTECTTDSTTDGTTHSTQTRIEELKNDKNKKSSAFVPPTIEEVKAYCQERNNNVNPQAFIDFYESKGWMIGKNKMKNWKSAVHTWENREPKKASKTMGKQNFDTFTDLYKN